MIHNRAALAGSPAREVALDCVTAGIERALPERVVAETVAVEDGTLAVRDARYDLDAFDEVLVVGGGNAAGKLAEALEGLLGDRVGGAVVTDAPGDCERIEQFAGSHPVPDRTGVEGTERIRALLDAADERSLVLAVVTGGGSALLPAPAGGLSLADLRATTEALLESGATIHEINAVRKHLSAVKGGGLARAAAPARTVALVVSDVVGNDLDAIASGPVVPDPSTFDDALSVLAEYDLSVPHTVRERLERGRRGEVPETPNPGDPVFERVDVHVLADGLTALSAAAEVAEGAGYEPLLVSSRVRGEAREAAKTHVAIAEEVRASGHPVSPPAVLLSGGETMVTVRGDGTGGPNGEFALSAALELDEVGVVLASVDTDGIDGATDAAGALVDADTVTDAGGASAALADNDAYPFLERAEGLVFTGRTGTNVNDLRVVVVEE
jgi:hydroxypyruvate reductase